MEPLNFKISDFGNLETSVITYSYHNIIFFASRADDPSKLMYSTLERPQLKLTKDREKLKESFILEKNGNLKLDWVNFTTFEAPENNIVSKIIAIGSNRDVQIRVYTEYSGPKTIEEMTPVEGDVKFTDLIYVPGYFFGWKL